MLVYLIKNTVNGKCYVGQTTQDVATRWRQHCSLQGRCRALENAIRKYGARMFEVSVVATVETQEELNRLERLTCEALKTYAPHGYNLKEGGGAKGKTHEQTKQLMRELALRPERLLALAEMRARPDVRAKKRAEQVRNGKYYAANMKRGRTPDVERRRIEATTRAWQTPEVRQAQSERQRVSQSRPEVNAKRSVSLKAAWDRMTDEQRAERGAQISAGTLGVKKTVSAAFREARSAATLNRWQNPEFRAKHTARLAALVADPEFLKRRGAAISAALAAKRSVSIG